MMRAFDTSRGDGLDGRGAEQLRRCQRPHRLAVHALVLERQVLDCTGKKQGGNEVKS